MEFDGKSIGTVGINSLSGSPDGKTVIVVLSLDVVGTSTVFLYDVTTRTMRTLLPAASLVTVTGWIDPDALPY